MARRRSLTRLAQLAADEQGAILVYVSIMAAMLVGVAGLTIDIGRYVTTNTQAKAAADASAIAAATAVAAAVRAPGADPHNPQPVIDAAWQAAQTGVSNRQTFANVTVGDATTVGGAVRITGLRLLTSLPELEGGSASDPVDAYVTTNPWQAHFVEVTTETLTQTNAFLPVVGTSRTSSTRATAIAGFHQVMCRIPPVWICNPAEIDGPGSIFIGENWRGRQIRLRSAAPASSWSPGNFGLLDSPYGQGVPKVTEALATDSPNTCFRSDGVDLRPGNANPVVDGLNTRFDIYGSPHLKNDDPAYRPALNVTKGIQIATPGDCNKKVDKWTQTPEFGMPRDSNLIADANARIGNGQWDCASYWNTIHDPASKPANCTSASNMTRYELYLHEIETGSIADPNGIPQCYKGPTPIAAKPDRRVLYFAIIDCSAGGLNGNRDDVPVAAFGKAFLTEYVKSPPDDEIYIEIIDVVRPGADDGALHEIVQLYR